MAGPMDAWRMFGRRRVRCSSVTTPSMPERILQPVSYIGNRLDVLDGISVMPHGQSIKNVSSRVK